MKKNKIDFLQERMNSVYTTTYIPKKLTTAIFEKGIFWKYLHVPILEVKEDEGKEMD
jgi:hypothetical protein